MANEKNNVQWFKAQHQNSLDMFVWAVQQIPEERLKLAPPAGAWFEAWSVHQQIHHLYLYEKLILPFKRQWLPNASPTSQEDIVMLRHLWSEQERHWYKKEASHWLNEWCTLRKESIQLLKKYDESAWCETKETTFWGVKSLFWMYSKTLQHTLEHTDSVMKIGIFWDDLNHG
ncbi:MAG: hypothetical protein Q9P01_13815 [Anaerolineae bacterium]|nr:hypothetical protein [Anaerolineae bacterium]MDQ7035860.1 hypothetical protein [Anaerolineae bacterium]